jgi:hypothetical protein
MYRRLKISVICAGLALAAPLAAQAQDEWRHHHPHYVQAMSDVSMAYQLLRHAHVDPPARPQEEQARASIEEAYQTLENAAAIERRDINDLPPPDETTDERGRLYRVVDLLRDAREQLNAVEVDPETRELRVRAAEQIRDAAAATEEAIRIMRY